MERFLCLPGAGAQVRLATNVPLDAGAAVEAALGDAHVGLQEPPHILQGRAFRQYYRVTCQVDSYIQVDSWSFY